MDPLTHLLAGAAAADALSPARPNRPALFFSMFLAAAPDLDVIPALIAAFPANPFSEALFDSRWMLRLHRGPTHALPVLLAAGIALGLAAHRIWGRRNEEGGIRWIALALAAFLSHILLDMANGAVRLWFPFSREWTGWGQSPTADPALLLILGVCFAANHPFSFVNRRGLATLDWLERITTRIHVFSRRFAKPRTLAIACLTASGALLFARTAFGLTSRWLFP